jgi:hypothetical protein
MGSARTVTGVGPRCAFTVEATAESGGAAGSGMTSDNIIGGITATWEGTGVYHFVHNLGNTAYVAMFTTENEAGNPVGVERCGITSGGRGINGITCEVTIASSGVAKDPKFIHGIIHDGGG